MIVATALGCAPGAAPLPDVVDVATDAVPPVDGAPNDDGPGVQAADVPTVDVSVVDVPRTAPDAATMDVARDASADVTARTDAAADHPDVPAPRPLWLTGYYAGWMQDAVPPAALDLAAVTHVIHFSLVPHADGSLDAAENGLDAAHVRAAVAAVHGAHRKVLVSVGGAGTRAAFAAAWTPSVRPTFVANIARFVAANGYDGADLDVEPLQASDAANFQALARELHAALRAHDAAALMTAAVGDAGAAYVPVQALFDQLNVMDYDTSGPWPGWVTWHNTPLHNGGATFPGGGALPCTETTLAALLRAGVDRSRLGVGIDFYGYDWTGASEPRQSIAGVTTRTRSYAQLLDTYDGVATLRWDPAAMVPYYSLAARGGLPAHFVSFDDARSGVAKIDWARAQGLGGAMVWELAGGHRASQPAAEREALLTALGAAAR